MTKYYIITFFVLIVFRVYSQSLDLKKGQVYELNITDSTNIIAVENNNVSNIMMISEANIVFCIKDYENNNYLIEAYYKNLKITYKQPNNEIDLQSDYNNPFSLELKKIINKPFKMILSNNGKIIKINVDSILFTEKNEYFVKIKQEFGEKSLKRILELCFSIFPNKKPTLKEKWIINRYFEKNIPETIKEDFEFVKENNDSYQINSKGFISSPNNVITMNKDSSFVKNNFIGDVKTEYLISKNSGWIKKATIIHRKIGDVYNKKSKLLMSINRKIFITGKLKIN